MGWAKLQKLRDKSADEWLTRGAQELAKWQERLFGKGCAAMSDAALQQALPDTTLTNLLTRLQAEPHLLPAFAQRGAVVQQMRARFPTETQRIIQQADGHKKSRCNFGRGFAL